MPDRRLSTLRRTTLREGLTFAVAAAGIVAVAASSAVSVADDSVPARVAVVAEQQPAAAPAPVAEAAPVAEVAPAPAPEAAAVPAPMPAPAPEPVPAPMPAPAPAPAPPVYENNLDGWIRQALDIMAANNIPGSYEGIHRNILRESSGNPQAINLWDSNAAAGIPSKGLLQVIDPTFAAYHVAGTPFDVWDPVANIVAACNYAAHRYGSMDNVNSAY
ncbi:Transglycosylase SLT domain-containing protein [Nocardia amikacinitolerans]|uniref:Transglycosylase SLT domain-containing protein n=1 Tax=Nocardia amikacinitolerans TaxID=756689 RepID=A0A285LE88_9NOCA|nr:transglycosylase SLT domain-containing protein [Nocardia amikacinitolerans]MCP2280481.1 Transglycosylase SLT domain-containing protein [Nocardia amikacinitolerans]MCP2297561.1 Transglycosylase SLT domain-containing protein [Nocardia amikacinitolerans]SNY81701.1 Transglycosylase SLT domain-containing protein [Nocardia amikacinitolerans]